MILAAVALLGLLVGSFANVLIWRVPQGGDVVRGRSVCTSCGHEIAWYDNVPLLSWLILRGRCRSCRAPISWVYPVVEASVAVLWVVVYSVWGLSFTAAMFAFLAVISVVLTVIDIRHHRLPHRIVLPSIGVVAVLATAAWIVGERDTWWTALIGAAALGGFYAILWLIYPKGMGFGDVTTATLLGFAAGFLGLQYLAVSAIAGPLVGGVIVIVLAAGGRVRKRQAIPYGPALIVGAWIGYLWAPAISTWYLGSLGLG